MRGFQLQRVICRYIAQPVAVLAGVLALWSQDTATSWAGVHYSGERYAPLPAQWSGFLMDWRTLRQIAQANPTPPTALLVPTGNDRRQRYQEQVQELEKRRLERPLTADQAADLGALYLRLGEPQRALSVLRQAYQEHPRHFAIVANLGTAWQRNGNLEQAAILLEQAVQLAPPSWQRYEQYHLRLVQERRRRSGESLLHLDDLFGVRYENPDGTYPPLQAAPQLRHQLPEDALAIVQQLLLWLPDDAALVWQLAELAVLYGEVNVAQQLFDLLVTAWGVASPKVRAHRQALRELAAAAKAESGPSHPGHKPIAFRSRRALLPSRSELDALPPVSETGVNLLRWDWLLDTQLDEKFRPSFPPHLRRLEGKRVALTGFMQPLSEELEHTTFMLLEYPVGCWYCEMPPTQGIVFVELADQKAIPWQPGLLKIVGRLRLNDQDPEDFLFHIRQAQASQPD
ncbi:MAG: tetratricopeptide repeat protein [Gemmatales bacterium]|nr:tetratricopeptide repeat protein [Gemmatales bacterium]MDW8174217.1 tetratricopeptide repeat protein [Gemmatales bacterium]